MKVIKHRYIYFAISGAFFLVSLFLILFSKPNLWIDMTGGVQMEYTYNNLNIENIKTEISSSSDTIEYKWAKAMNSTSVYKVTGKNILTVVWWFNKVKKLQELKWQFRSNVLEILQNKDKSVIESSYINIWKSFWDYIKQTAKLTLIIAIIGIALYIAWAFSWVVSGVNVLSFSSITIITLFHDVLLSSWLYMFVSAMFPEFKIDTFFVTALLTILGYSINDTIVVFDRVRSNLRNIAKTKSSLEDIIDLSITETLRRSIYTSMTLFFTLLTIFFFWPESLKWFTLVMIFWTIIWTYSSIFIASPMLYEINKNKNITTFKVKKTSIEDKIVV